MKIRHFYYIIVIIIFKKYYELCILDSDLNIYTEVRGGG
jgi:hypothetical protein